MAEALRKTNIAETPLYREAPNNIEAEQALLGAILVNNDAYYRVSDFLKQSHFYEPLHRKIFEVAGELIRMGKMANPVTIKTFLPADGKVGDMTVAHYLARIASRGRHRHQRLGLWPRDLRPRDAPRADHGRRGHGQHRL